MNKFFLMTRGRTGSTAVIDELGRSRGICAVQELFMKYDYGEKQDFEYVYNIVMPFDVWNKEPGWRKKLPSFIYDDAAKAGYYLKEAESIAKHQGAKSLGFKVLSYHFEERPYLARVLKQREYRVLYLTRNLARQVLSSMVSHERGIFGVSQDFEDRRRYRIDVDKFQRIVMWEQESVEKERAWLAAEGFPFIDITYEDFLSDRPSFYNKIFRFLGLPPELPPSSDWGIAIKDLTYTIENYEAIAERAAAMGVPINS